jgi:hypothetical protein
MRSVAHASVPERPRVLHDLSGRRIAILQLSTNKLRKLTGASLLIQSAISTIHPGEFRKLRFHKRPANRAVEVPGSIGTPGSSIPQPLFCSARHFI